MPKYVLLETDPPSEMVEISLEEWEAISPAFWEPLKQYLLIVGDAADLLSSIQEVRDIE